MTMHELDPDVVQRDLHLIDVCCLTNNGSPQTVTCYEVDSSWTESVEEGFLNSTCCSVENDEVIARALQEELSRLNVEESFASFGEQHQKEYIHTQDWPGTSRNQSNFELGDESVGKRLNQMIAVPHVPKVNREIPSADEATSDHQRLLNRLQLYDLVELKISGDGNCQFRSLSDQIYRSPEHHQFVREQVINQLKSQPELYENYVPMAYGDYLKRMSKTGEWGDHITLQAGADWYGMKILVITSFKDTCYIEILPQSQKSDKIIFLSFWAEVHYNSIYPFGELPQLESKKTKGWSW